MQWDQKIFAPKKVTKFAPKQRSYCKNEGPKFTTWHPICDEKECTPYSTNCGGIILDELTILSAAHCFVYTDEYGRKYNSTGEPYNWDVIAGTKSSLPSYGEVSKII